MINPVPSKQLVRSFTGEYHLDVFRRQLGDEIQGNTGRIRQRLIEIVLDLGHSPPVFLLRYHMRIMLDPHLRGQLCGKFALVIVSAVVKTHREGLLSPEIGGDIAGVHPSGQKAANLHVADTVRLHRVGEDPVDSVHRFFKRHCFLRMEYRLPVTMLADPAVLVPQEMSGGQAENILKKGFPRQGILERQIVIQRRLIEFLDIAGMPENGFYF